jgi:hypothetical protein
MAVQIFRSTDAGAPVLNGTAGSLISIFDHCLVTGASWTKTSLGSNQAAYTQPVGSNGFSIQVDDSAGTTAQITAYETISAFNTGTNEWHPSGGRVVVGKDPFSVTPPIGWRLITNGNLFHFTTHWYPISGYSDFITFGDIVSYSSTTDIYNTILAGSPSYSNSLGWLADITNSFAIASSGMSVDRSYDQSTLNPSVSTNTNYQFLETNSSGANGLPFPNCDGSLSFSPIWLGETAHSYRGLIPGVWCVNHQYPFNDGDQVAITSGPMTGRTFECVGTSGNQAMIELSNTWGGF